MAGHTYPGKHHDKRHAFVPRRDHRSDDASFAVADQPYPERIYLMASPQVFDGRFGIVGKIGRGSRRETAAGLCRAAVVLPQHADTVSGQVIGYHQKGFMSHQFFVTVLRATARDQDDNGILPIFRRQR